MTRIEQILLNAATAWPSKLAIVDGDCEYTFHDLKVDALNFSEQLRLRGVSPHCLVALFMEKSYHSVVAFFGSWMAGAVVVPLFEGLKSKQIQQIIMQSGTHFVISTSEKVRGVLVEAFDQVPVFLADELLPSSPHLSAATPVLSTDMRESACIFHSSGSTGLPKGILFGHDNLIAGTRIVKSYLDLRESDVILSVLPFSFDYGLNQLLISVDAGATLVLNKSPFAADIFNLIRAREITGLAGVPPFWANICNAKVPAALNLRFLTNSGGHLSSTLVNQLVKVFPRAQIFLMYGLTEAFRSTYLPPAEIWTRVDSIGKAIPESEVFILSERGTVCGPGEVGELVHSGPTVSKGYWRDPKATARVFRPHPLRPDSGLTVVYSGDLAKYDEDGFIYFVGRNDEMGKIQGQRVSPLEVENALYESRLLREVAVLLKQDTNSIASLLAHCVPSDPTSFSVESLLYFCRKELPTFMIPRFVYIHDQLPKTSTGKIDRMKLASV